MTPWLLAATALLTACAGKALGNVAEVGDAVDSGSDAGTAGDGSTADGSSHHGSCPENPPDIGSACTKADLQCEYGGSLYPGCNRTFQCSSGTWQSESFGGYCPRGANAPDCPASMSEVTVGGNCNADSTPSCHYDRGQCYCGFQFGPPHPPGDAGPPTTWSCDDPGPDCTFPRPMLGDACSREGQQCMYLTCELAETCTGGVWTASPIGCAGANGGAAGGR